METILIHYNARMQSIKDAGYTFQNYIWWSSNSSKNYNTVLELLNEWQQWFYTVQKMNFEHQSCFIPVTLKITLYTSILSVCKKNLHWLVRHQVQIIFIIEELKLWLHNNFMCTMCYGIQKFLLHEMKFCLTLTRSDDRTCRITRFSKYSFFLFLTQQ